MLKCLKSRKESYRRLNIAPDFMMYTPGQLANSRLPNSTSNFMTPQIYNFNYRLISQPNAVQEMMMTLNDI